MTIIFLRDFSTRNVRNQQPDVHLSLQMENCVLSGNNFPHLDVNIRVTLSTLSVRENAYVHSVQLTLVVFAEVTQIILAEGDKILRCTINIAVVLIPGDFWSCLSGKT